MEGTEMTFSIASSISDVVLYCYNCLTLTYVQCNVLESLGPSITYFALLEGLKVI